jgi:hypothetical protein
MYITIYNRGIILIQVTIFGMLALNAEMDILGVLPACKN